MQFSETKRLPPKLERHSARRPIRLRAAMVPHVRACSSAGTLFFAFKRRRLFALAGDGDARRIRFRPFLAVAEIVGHITVQPLLGRCPFKYALGVDANVHIGVIVVMHEDFIPDMYVKRAAGFGHQYAAPLRAA